MKELPTQRELKAVFSYKFGGLHRDGRRAGYVNKGYRVVYLGDQQFFEHRLIWKYVTGDDPAEFDIDHIDGNTLNNDFENLRLADRKTNCRNQRRRTNNSSGVTGVSANRGGWLVQWTDKRRKRKWFKDFDEAVRFRAEAVAGLGYTERHGA